MTISAETTAAVAAEQQQIEDARMGKVCTPPPAGMVAWYPFDETSGTTTVNRRGPSPIANLINQPAHVPGKVGYALQFDGMNDVVRSTTADPNLGTGDFSIDFWMKTTTTKGTFHVLEKRTRPTKALAHIRGYAVAITDGKLLLQIGNGSSVAGGFTNYVASATSVADGTWHHVAITVQRTVPNGICFYDNGVLKATADPTGRQGDISNSALLTIGEDTFGIVARYKGLLDELEIFSRALTAAEVQTLHSADALGKCKLATAYVTNNQSSTVTPIDVSTNSAQPDIAVPGGKGGPERIAITPNGQWAYVVRTGFGGNMVTPIDLSTNTLDTPVSLNWPIGFAITPDGKWAYVATPNNLVRIDLLNGNLLGPSIPIPGRLFAVAVSPNGAHVYVSNTTYSTVTRVSTSTNMVSTTFQLLANSSPQAIEITPDGKWAYVANANADTVVPINLATNNVGSPIALPAQSFPNAIAISPNGGSMAYVTAGGTGPQGKVYPISIPGNVVGPPILVDSMPSGIAITPDGGWAYVSCSQSNTVRPVNLTTAVPTVGSQIGVGTHPAGLAIRPD